MLVRSGEARGSDADRHLAWSLAGIAGSLNTAAFYAVGLYSSNMTGNVSSLADHLGLGDVAAAMPFLGLVGAFISGAAISALLINAGKRRNVIGIYAFSILTEALLLIGLACVDLWLSEGGRGPLLAYGLSFLMGLQNAVVTRISDARVRTTHVTGMVTDIGIELGNLLDLAWHRGLGLDYPDEGAFNREKLRLHGFTVIAFLVGGVVGVVAYRSLGAYFLFSAAVLLLLLAIPGLLKGRRQALGSAPRAGGAPMRPRHH